MAVSRCGCSAGVACFVVRPHIFPFVIPRSLRTHSTIFMRCLAPKCWYGEEEDEVDELGAAGGEVSAAKAAEVLSVNVGPDDILEAAEWRGRRESNR